MSFLLEALSQPSMFGADPTPPTNTPAALGPAADATGIGIQTPILSLTTGGGVRPPEKYSIVGSLLGGALEAGLGYYAVTKDLRYIGWFLLADGVLGAAYKVSRAA